MPRIDGDLRKSVGPVQTCNRKIERSGPNDAATPGEGLASIVRPSECDRVAIGPDGVDGAVGRDRSGKSLHRAVVVAGQAVMGADVDRGRPCLAPIRRSRQKNHAIVEMKFRPADVEIAGVPAIAIICHNVGLIFKRNPRLGRLRNHGVVLCLPGGAAIRRAANKNPVARRSPCPVIFRSQLIEGDVAQDGGAMLVVGYRHIAGNLVVGRSCARRRRPRIAAVLRKHHAGV